MILHTTQPDTASPYVQDILAWIVLPVGDQNDRTTTPPQTMIFEDTPSKRIHCLQPSMLDKVASHNMYVNKFGLASNTNVPAAGSLCNARPSPSAYASYHICLRATLHNIHEQRSKGDPLLVAQTAWTTVLGFLDLLSFK
ncbi:hypothetical protein WAI453_005208 [Rhynchosporium graminicola]